MDKEKLVKELYTPIFDQVGNQGLFKTEKQKLKWWDVVNNGLDHTKREVSAAANSNIITGTEILADACCVECSKYNGKVFKRTNQCLLSPLLTVQN